MKCKFLVLSTGVLFGALALPALASEQRVIEETLLYKDPTVAAGGRWIYGVSAEAFVQSSSTQLTNINTNVIETGNVSGTIPGLNLFVGYDNFTFTYHYKTGSTTSKFGSATGAWTSKQNDTYNEATARWLIKGVAESFTPYVGLGYGAFSETATSSLDSGNNMVTGRPTYTVKTNSTYTFLGLGTIIPMNEKLGFRVDAGIVRMSAKWAGETAGAAGTGSGSGGRYTGTAYYNFAGGWNAQLGARIEKVSLGAVMGSRSRTGAYAMLGYTFR